MFRPVVLLCIVMLTTARSQESSNDTGPSESSIGKDVSMFIDLTTRGLTAPLYWDTRDWKAASGIVLGTGISSVLDDESYEAVLHNRNATNDHLERVFEAYSNGLSGILFSTVLYGAGHVVGSEWLRSTGLMMASALTISAITQTTLKYIAGRARPYTREGNHRFRPFSFNSDFVSFPSGHTIVAFTISTVLSERIDNPLVSVVLYSAAVMGGLSRIYSGNHWLSDVVFGAGLAISVSRSVQKWYEERMMGRSSDARMSPSALHVAGAEVYPGPNRLTLVWRF